MCSWWRLYWTAKLEDPWDSLTWAFEVNASFQSRVGKGREGQDLTLLSPGFCSHYFSLSLHQRKAISATWAVLLALLPRLRVALSFSATTTSHPLQSPQTSDLPPPLASPADWSQQRGNPSNLPPPVSAPSESSVLPSLLLLQQRGCPFTRQGQSFLPQTLPIYVFRVYFLKGSFPSTFTTSQIPFILKIIPPWHFSRYCPLLPFTAKLLKKSHPHFSLPPQPGQTSAVTATTLNPTIFFSPHCLLKHKCLWWPLPAGLRFLKLWDIVQLPHNSPI